MAAEVPVSDVLCEAMEYLSKLGSNLRSRSESLKEKRISKNKLKNAHAVHKAAQKVLLICELSKKSLENVETGVRKVLKIVGASQAPHTDDGGKTIHKKKDNNEKFYYFECDSHKLRISKKIYIKHYTSVKVHAKRMPVSMQDKYPVYYDCKLKRQRRLSVNRRSSDCDNVNIDLSQENKKKVDPDEDKLRNTSLSDTEGADLLEIQNDISKCKLNDTKQINKDTNNWETITKSNNSTSKDDLLVSELSECFANEAKVDEKLSNKKDSDKNASTDSDVDDTSKRKHKRIKKKATSIRKKFSKITIDDDSSKSDDEHVKKVAQKECDIEKDASDSEPKLKKLKLGDTDDESKSVKDSDRHSVDTKNSDDDQQELDNDSKPKIRCVNITKLLKPDILDTKVNKSDDKQVTKNKQLMKKSISTKDVTNELKKLSTDKKIRKENKYDMESKSDSEFWAQKRKEVKLFKSKPFSVKMERLSNLTVNFLHNHKLQKIIQAGKIICEVIKEKDVQVEKKIDEVKTALLNDSGSEETDNVLTAITKEVKDSLLNDSDSEKEDSASKNSNENAKQQSDSEKLTDAAVIKDALLNESDPERNEQAEEVTSETCVAYAAEKIKNELLNDSDSDNNQREEGKKDNGIPEDKTEDGKDEHSKNKSDNEQSEKNSQDTPTLDPEKIKSSLLNDSPNSESELEVIKKIKRKLKLSRHERKLASKRKQAKQKLLSSSEDETEQSQESDKETNKHKLRKSNSSGEENETRSKSKKKRSKLSDNEDKDSRSIDQVDSTDEHSNSSVRQMVRSKAKPSGSSGQNSDNQEASDKDIDGLTNLNSLNKPHRRRDSTSTNNTETRSSSKKHKNSKGTPIIGEELLATASSSDESDDDNMGEEDLPPVNLSGLNGSGIGHLAKDDLLGESDSSVSQEKEQSGQEESQNMDDSEEEENVKLKRRKANAISSDSEGGTSRRKQDEDVRVSDFEDSEADSAESTKRSKRKKKGTDSDASGSSIDGGKKKRRRIKTVRDSDVSGSDTENEGRNKHGRKNIRKVMGKNQLEEATKKAAREEKERIARITERQKLYNNLDFDESGKPDEVVLEKVVLDFDPETKEPLIEVDRGLVKKLKPHQANGIKFMWDACFESVKRIKKDKGSGCILAHCMGLGKTLQVISLTHTLLIHGTLTGVNRVLVVCPLSTVLNWVNEFKMWLKHAHSEFEVDVYELSRYKQNSERAFQLQQWFDGGGVCVLGYEMFRNLSADNNKKFKKKMLRSFQEALVDPGPDLVVCDEGHLLKNEKTSLSQSMNRVKTRRRIVLTGTPLQNNLKEYYCMVQFVKPNLLGKYNEYLNRFVNPITNGQYTDSTEHDIKVMKRRSHVLHKMLDGAVQRRDYGVLAPFLPPKHEYVLFITLSDVQVKLYQFYLDNYSRRPLPGKSSGFLFPDFQSLQRIWTHPLVLKYNSERYEIMQQKKREREEEDSEGSLVDFIDDDSTPEETSTEESSDDLSDVSDDSRKKSKKKKSAKKSKGKESKVGTRRGTRANPIEIDDEDPDVSEVIEVKNENPTEWWIKLVEEEELEDMRNSHKLVLLFDILRQCEAIGDKLLVFSQSLYSLDLIEHFLGKVDEATQEGRIDEKLGGHVGSWSPGVDYFRLDGSTSCENRSIWCKNFNREDNPRARLFLISTRAGGLGINLVAANRVVIFDVSWNPSHDVQSIFRVYRFGQKKPCYVYRFLAMGTMEEKIYERQVTKQAISKRVIDEQQIDRHYAENDLAELYKFEARPDEPRPLPTLPKDRLFAEMLREHEAQIYKYHEHDSLLENKEEETLSEEERKAAWEDFENEKNKPPPAPFPSAWPMHNGMVPGLLAQQQQQLAYAALAAMLRKDMPNINDNQIRDMLPLIYNSNPALMQKMSEIYKYAQPGMMNPGMMNPVMNPASASSGGAGGSSGLQYEPPWQRQHQQQQQMRLQQLMQQNQQMGAKFYAGGLGSRDPVAMALQQQRAREIMLGGAGRPRGRPPLAPRAPPAAHDVVNLDSD